MKILTLDVVKEILEDSGYFGFRGLSGIYGSTEYAEGDILEYSIDDWDGRDIEFNDGLDRLDGTSAIGVNEYMEDEKIIEMYKKALRYSDCGKVILINGNRQTYGADQDEVVISYKGDGAMFLGYVEI
jgi:hypothetical protein